MADKGGISREQIQSWLSEVNEQFTEFRHYRKLWNQMVHRELAPVLDKRLGRNVATYKTPDLEEVEQLVADILTRSPSRFVGNLRQEGTKAEQAMKEGVLHAAHTWGLIEDPAMWIDRDIGIGQARHGVKVMRMLHNPIETPEVGDEDDLEDAMEQPWPWYFEDVDVEAIGWLMKNRRPEVCVYEYEAPMLVRGGDDYKVSGKTLAKHRPAGGYSSSATYVPSIDQAGKLVWVGDASARDESTWSKKLRGVVIEYLSKDKTCPVCDDAHPLWCGVEILCGPNDKFEDGEIIREYTLPYRHAPSFRIVPGRENVSERNPHWRYRPLLYTLLVEAAVINWCLSVLLTLANRDSADNRLYATLAGMPADVADRVPAEFWDEMKIDLPDPERNEVPVLPVQLEAWPAKLAEILFQVYQDAVRRFEAAKPNRFLTGDNTQEAAQGTMTANLQATQQSALPFRWLLTQKDVFIREAKADQWHAVRYWEYEKGGAGETKFRVNLSGEEQVQGDPKAGTSVYLSASKAEYQYDLVIITDSDTLQEQAEKRRQAFEAYHEGFYDDEQVIEALGFYNTDAQKRRLRKYQLKRAAAPRFEASKLDLLTKLAAVVGGVDQSLLMQGRPQMPSMGGRQMPGGGGGAGGPPQLPAVEGAGGGSNPTLSGGMM
ncbi:MAG: hypothetical protein AB7E70_20205 [Hyphomicrobiaceae bacterium]